ncbi:MAG: flagellar biosynthesis protein FlhA [Deltaproteobacteria bacterium]|nr:flagellar biosynthesis protein FlhA [Deltaproteobacteria bacterium]
MAMPSTMRNILKEGSDLILVGCVVGVVLLMVIPLPPFLLDLALVGSIALSILLLLVAFYANRPLDFSVFPVMLLFATLLRLTLNIASTRLILLHGAEGEAAAGNVIRAFGFFAVSGNYVVGVIVFLILILINFVVITKGAGRIAEVAARFTLDAMPGKQLAVDADLAAGLINEADARSRREMLQREADFYGAMDGASKFVRGDAIAGIVIMLVNIFGGLVIGVAQQGLSFAEAARIYTMLTVGDGLVAQLPALIVSTAAGLIVTKVSKQQRLSDEITSQAFGNWRPLAMGAAILGVLGMVPGLPLFPFFVLASMMGWQSYRMWMQQKATAAAATADGETPKEAAASQELTVPPLDLLEVEVGYDLIPLVDQRAGGEFPARIVGVRRQFANEMGLVLPPVHIRDNLRLKPNEYRFFLKGAVVGRGDIMPHHALALDPGMTTRKLEGIQTTDPAFGLDALWIPEAQKESAIVAGYTVVDLPSVMATHLVEIVRKNLSELFGRQELSNLLEQAKATHPKVVSDLNPEVIPVTTVLRVFQNLLRERVSIRDRITVLETIVAHHAHTKDPEELTEYVRVNLGRAIAQQHKAADDTLYAITLDRTLEERLAKSVTHTQSGPQIAVDPNMARTVIEHVGREVKRHVANSQAPVVLTSQQLRPHLYRLLERFIPNLAVLAHGEVAGHVSVRPLGMVAV